jgi:hypothetical protein
MRVEGKRWKGVVNKVKYESCRESGIYAGLRFTAINRAFRVPRLCDSIQNFISSCLLLPVKCCWEVTKQTDFASARGSTVALYGCETWYVVSREEHTLTLRGTYVIRSI